MRRLFLLAICFSLSAYAQTAAPPAPPASAGPVEAVRPAPATDVPSDSNCRARPAWCQAARDRVAAAKGHPVDILFVGDSITEGWTAKAWGGVDRGAAVWDKVYTPRNALNFGVGADATQNVLYRLDTMDVQELAPKVVVLLIGTNNTRNSAAQIAVGIHAVLAKLEAMYPAAKIILVSILPNARAGQLMEDTNQLIQEFADSRTVFYLDVASHMPPVADHNFLGLGPDRLHPSAAGYQIWADTMEPLLSQLLGEAGAPSDPQVPAARP